MKTTRNAILIGNPGTRNNFLKGVHVDLFRMRQYLISDKGGAWNPNEVTTLEDPTAEQVNAIIKSTIADYVFVYFSGHGYTDEYSNRMIALKGSSVPDTSLLNRSPRQLILVDACRNYVSEGISGIPDYETQIDHFEGSPVREIFDDLIAKSPTGKLIIHATQIGKYSYDSPNGGYFTQALLQLSTKIDAANEYTYCDIERILHYVPEMLRRNNNHQTPTVTYRRGDLNVPFAIGLSSLHLPLMAAKRALRTRARNQGWAIFGLLTLLGITIAAASKSK